uniref:hypothetical protein n=1 Tax=Rhodococcus sp. H36-A4 TaxID=3004353 RepID=UPI003FA6DB39
MRSVTKVDSSGRTPTTYAQTHRGVPIFAGFAVSVPLTSEHAAFDPSSDVPP